jgi:nucleoside-diphosphate-sugar epimerase
MAGVRTRGPHYRSLPRRFRRPGLVLLGCGDVGLRFARLYGERLRIVGVVRRADAAAGVRAAGARPLRADLDDRRHMARLGGLAPRVLHSAPPPAAGPGDPRTRRALAALHRARTWVYLSTTGVYGDCGGARIDETRPTAPGNERAIRRVAAERLLHRRAASGSIRATVLRVPGIYAADRLPLERLRRGTPALADDDDVFTSHVHADDLARIAFAALWRGRSQRVVNAVDASDMKMGEYFDAVARALGLPPPPRLARDALREAVSPTLWSFMSESRRLDDGRLRRELRVRLRYPTVAHLLRDLATSPPGTRPPAPRPG